MVVNPLVDETKTGGQHEAGGGRIGQAQVVGQDALGEEEGDSPKTGGDGSEEGVEEDGPGGDRYGLHGFNINVSDYY